jgi:hypothetical protein
MNTTSPAAAPPQGAAAVSEIDVDWDALIQASDTVIACNSLEVRVQRAVDIRSLGIAYPKWDTVSSPFRFDRHLVRNWAFVKSQTIKKGEESIFYRYPPIKRSSDGLTLSLRNSAGQVLDFKDVPDSIVFESDGIKKYSTSLITYEPHLNWVVLLETVYENSYCKLINLNNFEEANLHYAKDFLYEPHSGIALIWREELIGGSMTEFKLTDLNNLSSPFISFHSQYMTWPKGGWVGSGMFLLDYTVYNRNIQGEVSEELTSRPFVLITVTIRKQNKS